MPHTRLHIRRNKTCLGLLSRVWKTIDNPWPNIYANLFSEARAHKGF